jgi:hypothetical protein
MVVATYLSGNTDFATGAARREDLTLTKFNVARTQRSNAETISEIWKQHIAASAVRRNLMCTTL